MANREINTARLSLRPLRLSDLDDLHALWTDDKVCQFLWDGERVSLKRTQEIIETSCRLFDERGFGLWGVRERDLHTLLGFAGYRHFRTPPQLELLVGVASAWWSRGFATEAAQSVIRYGFDVLGFDQIIASTDAANLASLRLIDKLGMQFQRRATVDGLDTLFYSLTSSEPGVE